jgi:ABC-type antimicrobial peptide transport system permease subunit
MENMVYGYINVATLVQLGEEPTLNELNILVAQNRFDESHIRRVAGDVQQFIKNSGHQVFRVDIPAPGKHPHSDLTGALLLAMSSFGVFVLVLSGILVINLLTAMMASQVRQIGVMKAIGGTRWQIARIYFSQALFLGAAAVIVSVPLGILGSRALCHYMAMFLNFDINSFAVPVWVYLLVAVIGIAAPLMAAAYPVWSGTAAPVRVALSDFGLSQTTFGASRFDRALARIGGTFRLIVFAIRNSFRRRTRLVLTLLTLAAAGVFFLAALNIRASLVNTLDRMFAARKFDLTVSLAKAYEVEKVEKAISNTPGIKHSETWFSSDTTDITDAGVANYLGLALQKSDADSVNSVKADLDRNLEQQGVRARGSTSKAESRFAYDEHMLMIYVFLIVMSVIIGGVGGLGLMTTMSLNVFERRREMGVMRALGATPRIVWLMIVAEGIVIGLLSWTIAALLAWPVSKVVGDTLVRVLFRSGLDFTFELWGLLIWLVVSIVLSAGASFLPAWKASRVTVREALAYE